MPATGEESSRVNWRPCLCDRVSAPLRQVAWLQSRARLQQGCRSLTERRTNPHCRLRCTASVGLLGPQQLSVTFASRLLTPDSPWCLQIYVVVPPLASGGSFDVRLKLSGSSSVSGPGGEFIEAKVQLFSEPMGGTFTGAAVMTGNSTSELEANKGHYMADMLLKPIVQQFKLPAAEEPEGDAAGGDAEGKEEAAAPAEEAGAELEVTENGADGDTADTGVGAAGATMPDTAGVVDAAAVN